MGLRSEWDSGYDSRLRFLRFFRDEFFEDRLFKCNLHFYRWSFILRNSRRMIMPYEKKKLILIYMTTAR